MSQELAQGRCPQNLHPDRRLDGEVQNVLHAAWGLSEGRSGERENGQGTGGAHLLWI
jgi:hypothetical protein